MREVPGLDSEKISACLQAHYGLRVTSVTFLPIGYEPNAAVYEVASCDGGCHFLKVRFGPVHEPGLLVPRTLIDLGIPNVLAPYARGIRTSGARSIATPATASSYTRS
jgi:spectinomycin phosphotransferase